MPCRRSTTPRPGRCSRTRALAVATVLVLGHGCAEPRTDPQRTHPETSTTEVEPSTGSQPPPATSSTTTGPESLDTEGRPPEYPSPDCTGLLHPGRPSDVAATPRPDHDAEVLALALDPTAAVATQADYESIAADLAAIRALDPTLEAVHVGCVVPNGVAFWFFDAEEINTAIWAGDYHSWDCPNQYYGRRQELRIDELAVAIELDGVYGEAVWQAYAALPGLGDQVPHWFQRDDWPVPARSGPDCESSTAIERTATALDEREYRFEREDGEVVVYRITGDEPPQPVAR